MPLQNDNDWKRAYEILSNCLPLESLKERRNFAEKILGKGPLACAAFAGMVDTPGLDTFAYRWNSSIETIDDPEITRKYVEGLLNHSIKSADRNWLREMLGLPPEPVVANRPADAPINAPINHAVVQGDNNGINAAQINIRDGVTVINHHLPPNERAQPQDNPVCFIIREEGRSTRVDAKSINMTLVRIDPLARNDRLEIPLRISLLTDEENACIDNYFASRSALSGIEAHASEQLMTQIGSRLFQSIFSDNRASNELARCRENHRAMEFVVEGSPAFHSIPWELLHYVFGHANQSIPIISQYPIFRQLTAPSEFHSKQVPQDRLRILWVTARHPKGDFMRDAVLAEVGNSLPKDQVDIKVIESGGFLEMIRALEEHTRTPKYHVLHLDMHGIVSSPAELRSKYGQSNLWAMDYREAGLGNLPNRGDNNYDLETSFVLFNQGDKVMPVSAAELSARLAVPGVPLVVLNACQSATVPAAKPSLIAHLVQAGGFPAVGFQQPTTLACTHLFFKTFYQTLLSNTNRRDIQESVHRGRRELHDTLMRGSLGIIDWWLPVLYTMPGRRTL
jgi:hypothetical protein